MFSWPRFSISCALALIASSPVGQAIILYRTADPSANTTAPTGPLANSGWQYEGTFGDYLGTVIAHHYFITAQHIGTFSTFTFQGIDYPAIESFDDPDSDLRLWKVDEAFPIHARLYSHHNEVGGHALAIGRGTQRGGDRIVDGLLRGWDWGATDEVQRWGENTVADIRQLIAGQDQLYLLFDENGLPNECHLSSGDSGGAVFVLDSGGWRLAGINYDVDMFAHNPDGTGLYAAALYDERGSFLPDGTLVTGKSPVPSGFYATRISSRIDWINSIASPRLVNLSTRVEVGVGDNVSIAGFIIEGDPGETKSLIVRGLGPSLETNGTPLSGRLSDPLIQLYNSSGVLIASNDNWRATQENEIAASGLAPSDDHEAAVLVDLGPGSYTAVLAGANQATGTGLVEVYELDSGDDARLLNLSTRGFVGTNEQVLIGGVIVRSGSNQLILRALGPELADRNVGGVLSDPTIELHDADGTVIASNDDWKSDPNHAAIANLGLAPLDPQESALMLSPGIGSYTAVVSGADETTGVALLEAYLLDDD